MKKPRRRIEKNYPLRRDLIEKGIITPPFLVPQRLKERGFTEAAKVAAERLALGQALYRR
jgi:hypothetical protein